MADRRSDEQLVAATLAGNREAFGELVARHRDAVFSLANGRLRDFEAAGDATQEAFLKAYLDLADLRDPAKFRAWVQRIAERIVITVARRPRREIPTAGLKIEDERWSELKLAERADLARRIQDGLSLLSEPTRTALVLHHISGYSQEEVADRLGLTRAAVKTRLSRARAQLRRGGTRKGARRGRIGRIRGR